jgi:hypothetical protein
MTEKCNQEEHHILLIQFNKEISTRTFYNMRSLNEVSESNYFIEKAILKLFENYTTGLDCSKEVLMYNLKDILEWIDDIFDLNFLR